MHRLSEIQSKPVNLERVYDGLAQYSQVATISHVSEASLDLLHLGLFALFALFASRHLIVEADSARWPASHDPPRYTTPQHSLPTRMHLQPRPHSSNQLLQREDTTKMGKDPKAKAPSHSRSSGSISNLPYSAVAAAAEVDRKVYIPLCVCLVSFAVMVYIN